MNSSIFYTVVTFTIILIIIFAIDNYKYIRYLTKSKKLCFHNWTYCGSLEENSITNNVSRKIIELCEYLDDYNFIIENYYNTKKIKRQYKYIIREVVNDFLKKYPNITKEYCSKCHIIKYDIHLFCDDIADAILTRIKMESNSGTFDT